MLQKYYEMLDKFNKKLEDKDILVTNKASDGKKSPVEKKIIFIKENDSTTTTRNSSISKRKLN